MAAVTDDRIRRFQEPRQVLVRHDDDHWYTGWQDGWIRRDDGTWRASVRYTTAPGAQYDRAVPTDRVRPVDSG